MPPKPDLPCTGLDEFANKTIAKNTKSSEEESKAARKNNDALIIKELVSDNEEENVAQHNIVKKTVRPNIVKKEFVKPRQQEKTVRKTIKKVEHNRQNIHRPRGNQRNWNNMMSQKLGSNFEMFNKACYPKAVVNAVKGNHVNAVKASACWVWKTKHKVLDHVFKPNSASITLKKIDYIDAQGRSKIENIVDHKVKVIRCDNRTEFKNRKMNQFCEMKGILRQFSIARTPQQNRVTEKRNRILIKAAKIKSLEYSIVEQVEENLYIRFSENTPNVVGTKASDNAGQAKQETKLVKDYILLPLWTADPPFSQDLKSSHDDGSKPSSDDGKKVDEDPRKENECNDQEKEDNVNNTNNVSSTIIAARTNKDNELPFDLNMHALEDVSIFNFSNNDEDDDIVADINNMDTTIQFTHILTTRIHKDHPLDQVIIDLHSATLTRQMNEKDERGIMIRNKARLVAQGHTQEEGIDYDEVFSPVARIEAIELFLAYDSFKDLMVYQMDVKSAFLYGKIKKEVYVYQPPGSEDPDFPDRVYKVEKTLYGLHQSLRSWYETLSTYLLDNGFQRGKLTRPYSTKGELTFFLGLQVKQKNDGIFISQDKYVAEVLKKFGFTKVKNASTPMETQKLLLKDEDGVEVDVHMYRSMIGSLIKPTRKVTEVPQPCDPMKHVADEAIHKELGDSLVRVATTSRAGQWCQKAIGDTIAQTRFGNVSKLSNDSLLIRGNILQSDEDRMKQNELMELCTNLQTRVIDLEKTKTTQANEIDSLKRRVKHLEMRNKSRTHKLKRLYKVGLTAKVESSGDEDNLGKDASKQERRIDDIDADEDITLVNVQVDAKKDLGDEEVFVAEQEVVSTAATTVTTKELTLAQTLKALKTLNPKLEELLYKN
uniref:Reverse transcriptase Ty1/copia-type domain-containing protein n=1 Tax=Tanacetum cinerariifolium TaxID=118510 RepID=A0A6L2MV13_TANCI|nr:hypothetical protein [Tanacetum cinerariifolium]